MDYSDSTPDLIYGYDRRGRQKSIAQAGGMTTAFTFNDAGEVLTETYTGGVLGGLSVTNGYDSLLRRTNLIALNSANAVLYRATNSFDAAGRLAVVSDGAQVASYSYLTDSPLVSQVTFKQNSTPRMTTTRSYDYVNRLLSVSNGPAGSGQAPVSYAYRYNAANQRTQRREVAGSYWLYEYDALGQVKRGAKFFSDGYPVPGQQFEYAHDDIGNRQNAKAGGDETGANPRSANYTANNLNQYTSRTEPRKLDVLGLALGTATVGVSSSSAQNNAAAPWRKGEYFRKELNFADNSTPLWETVTVSATGESDVTGKAFVAGNPENFTYDDDGNLLSDGRWDYTWDAENRLVKLVSRSGAPIGSERALGFGYDGKGRRISKTVSNWMSGAWQMLSTNRFVYDGWNLIAVFSSGAEIESAYVWGLDLSGTLQGAGGVGGLLVVTNSGNGAHFCAYDGNGNVAALMKASDGTVSANYEYGPFGETIRLTGTMGRTNPFRFSSKYQDDESDFLYYGYRSYNPSTGRWLSRDSLAERGGGNLYGFVQNRVLDVFDILGLTPPWFPYPYPTSPLPPRPACKKACTCKKVAFVFDPNGIPGIFPGSRPGTVHVGFPVAWTIEVEPGSDPKKCKCKHSEKGTVTMGYPPPYRTEDKTSERSISCEPPGAGQMSGDAPGGTDYPPPAPGTSSEQYRFAYDLKITVTCEDSDGKGSKDDHIIVPLGPHWFRLETDRNGNTTTVPTPPAQ